MVGNASEDLKVKCAPSCHLQLAVCGDAESDSVIKAATAGGGVTPHPHIPVWEERTTGDRLADVWTPCCHRTPHTSQLSPGVVPVTASL